MDVSNIHIGSLIEKRVNELNIDISRICNFMDCEEEKIMKMYKSESLDSYLILRWSKLLKYDFFRLYSQHLILYAPQSPEGCGEASKDIVKSSLPKFKKNIYTKEIIDFILELIETNKKTKIQIIEEYKIPKTTLYKWLQKATKETK